MSAETRASAGSDATTLPDDARPGPVWIGLLLAAALSIAALIAVLSGLGQHHREIPSGPQGTKVFKVTSREHVETPVDYPQHPPVGGDHAPIWANCGVYSVPVPPELAVHAMEHGAVWVTYAPSLDQPTVDRLRKVVTKAYVGKQRFVLMSPYDGIGRSIYASGWGRQLRVADPDDPRLKAFLHAFAGGPQAPEPGYPCTGGQGTPSD